MLATLAATAMLLPTSSTCQGTMQGLEITTVMLTLETTSGAPSTTHTRATSTPWQGLSTPVVEEGATGIIVTGMAARPTSIILTLTSCVLKTDAPSIQTTGTG